MSKRLVFVLSASGVMLGAAAASQAEPMFLATEPTLASQGSAVLSQDKRSGLSEERRLAQLRAWVHGGSIHCSDPNCPLCHPQRLPAATL
ncbi:hypothetical protein [Chromobacterium alticapitis]|uniref:Uncharacterized protein n=1 Tax=Chromobacterium alticapitis TaxID=2073169 RepID=A0A2S5DGI3_9NEIS|nr:hypothetical protein [Chromobacterium alticapitis]POZ62127.1 hypothetical protein C2I19_09905 [Chromobacterium alticapitis]